MTLGVGAIILAHISIFVIGLRLISRKLFENKELRHQLALGRDQARHLEDRCTGVLDRKNQVEFTTRIILKSFLKVSEGNLEETMGEALTSLAKLTTVDRCHLVRLGPDGDSLQWVYQWTAPGIEPVSRDKLPGFLSSVPWFRENAESAEFLHLAGLDDLPDHANLDLEILTKTGAQSALAFPLIPEGKMLGYMLVAAVNGPGNWAADGIRMLNVLADALGTVLQRRDANRALQTANGRLASIIAFLPDPTFVIDSEKKVVTWNRAMEELTGIKECEILGKGGYAYSVPFYGKPTPCLLDHFGASDLGDWRRLYNSVEISGDTMYAESFLPLFNGGQGAYFVVTASPLYDNLGNIVGAIESLRDVTARKRAEEGLRISEQKFLRLIETMNDGMVILDADGTISFANQSLCSILGSTLLEILGTPVDRFLPDLTSGHSLEDWPGWRLGCGLAVEARLNLPGKPDLPLRLSPAYLNDVQGHFAGGMVIVSDMTPMHQAEARIRALNRDLEQKVSDGTQELQATSKALSRSEERYRRIIESLSEGHIFYSQDPQGNFTYVSPSYREILGYPRLEQFAAQVRKWLDEPENREARASSDKSRLGYRQPPVDLIVQHRDGTPMILEVQEGPVFDSQGRVRSVEGLCRDVTENRRNLKLIQEAQTKLVEAEKLAAVGGLVAGLSHEINTPIGIGVTAVSHLAQEAAKCNCSYQANQLTRSSFESFLETAQESAGLIQSNLNRAADLVRNFKLVATDQTAQQDRTFNLKGYLEDVVHSLSPRFRNTGFEILLTCPESLEMHCDPGALYQVISNLVMNSLTHGFEGLLVGEINIRAHQSDGHIVLEYRDSGNGMKSKDLARIYEPFFTTKRGRGGTGLGMHIVYNNVTQTMGGSITCTSKPGRGTRFTICVPMLAEVEHG